MSPVCAPFVFVKSKKKYKYMKKMTLLHTSPLTDVSIKEYRNILNNIREKIETQTVQQPFKSIDLIHKNENIGQFCINVLLGLKEKRKKSRCKDS